MEEIKNPHQQLEFEETSRKRPDTVIERLKQNIKRFENEIEKMTKALKAKGEIQHNCDAQLRNMREDYISLQVKEMDISEEKKHY